ncbi:methylated-DNA--[protein]-cysteine S-methyltransferase [uncultured Enterovirga sp.]|uniref:methylated-DNA--[protein]-cysteine S-methyltransferase n=1 Tax=uncultured Enterovirga sp. TaxID=2026352 RepID=UPI0035C9FA6D
MAAPLRFALFDTALGICALGWRDARIAAVHLPDTDAGETRAGVQRRFPGSVETLPSAEMQGVVDRIRAFLGGAPADLSDVALDLDGVPDFHGRVYAALLEVPRGSTTTYGDLAARIGEPGAARAVGWALGRNPVPIIVPCHRVLAAGGRTGGFTAPGGAMTKLRLLAIEGAAPMGQPSLF